MATKLQRTNVPSETVVEAKKSALPEYIMCHSVTPGGLHITCNSGNVYSFRDYGDECEIELRDLTTLVRAHVDHIFMPRIVIDNEDFLEQFPQVAKVYEHTYTKQDIIRILSLPVPEMKSEIALMPASIHPTLRTIIATEIHNGGIDSVKKIRALSEIFESDFNLISELFGD